MQTNHGSIYIWCSTTLIQEKRWLPTKLIVSGEDRNDAVYCDKETVDTKLCEDFINHFTLVRDSPFGDGQGDGGRAPRGETRVEFPRRCQG